MKKKYTENLPGKINPSIKGIYFHCQNVQISPINRKYSIS